MDPSLWPTRSEVLPDLGSTLGPLSPPALGVGNGTHGPFQKAFFMQDFLFSGILSFVHLALNIDYFFLIQVHFTDKPLTPALLLAWRPLSNQAHRSYVLHPFSVSPLCQGLFSKTPLHYWKLCWFRLCASS